MLNKLKSYLQFGNLFCGIEHTIKDGNETIIVTLLKKSKTEIDIDALFEVDSIEKAISNIPKKQHIVLVINNNNVITKSVESNVKDNLKLVYKAFPNINLDDFYFEVLHQNNKHFVSICRKEYINELIENYKNAGVSIINFSLGNTLVSSISNFIASEETITTSNALITTKDTIISSIEKMDEKTIQNYNVNGLEVSNNELLSLSAALQTVLQLNNKQTNFKTEKQILTNEYNHTRFFSQFLKFGGLFILGVLLINFLVFNHYFNKVGTLQQESQVNLNTKQKIISLNTSVTKTQKMVDDVLKSNTSKSSFYTNEIINSLPKTIILTELNYQPLEKRIRSDKNIELQKHIIIVSGNSNSSHLFSNWLSNLETKPWIKNIETIVYSDISKSKANFSIKISIDYD